MSSKRKLIDENLDTSDSKKVKVLQDTEKGENNSTELLEPEADYGLLQPEEVYILQEAVNALEPQAVCALQEAVYALQSEAGYSTNTDTDTVNYESAVETYRMNAIEEFLIEEVPEEPDDDNFEKIITDSLAVTIDEIDISPLPNSEIPTVEATEEPHDFNDDLQHVVEIIQEDEDQD